MKAIFGLGLACLLISCLAAPLAVASDVEETSTDEGGTGDSVTEHHDTNGTEHEEGGEHEEEHVSVHVVSWNYERVATPLMLCLVILCAGILKLIFHYADCLSSIVPESCLLIIFGVIVGAIIDIDAHPEVTQLDPDVFMLYLLPPIVLDSAYSLNDRVVFNNIGTILLFAGVGTIVNFLVIGPSLYALAWSGAMGTININIIQCLLFSSFIVAVDPVAVLAIFSEIGVNTKLYFLVFGESLLNDAVTIVLYNMMVAFNQLPEITYDQILIGVASFFTISLGALSIGIGHGVICSVLTRFTGHVRVTEPLVIIITAYLSYLVAELFHWSGIISMIACGIMQAQYALHNISRKSYITVKYFVKMMSSSADCIVFIYLGLELVRTSHVWHAGFIVWSLSLCLIVRLLCVFTLTAIVNAKQHVSPIGIREQFIMWYGGLRGAVCFALAATLSSDFPLRQVFLTTTLVVIIFTVFVQGLTIKPLVSLCKIEREAEKHRSIALEFNLHVTDHMMAGVEVILGQLGNNYIRSLLQRINDKYLRQALMVNPMTQDERILAKYQKIAVRDHVKHIYEATSKEVDVGDVDKSEDILGDDTETQPKEEIRPKRHSRFHASRGEGEDGEDREKLAQLRWAMAKSVVTMFHQKYDKNLTRDDENDLVGHLREKHHRIAENHRMRSPPTSPRGTAPSSPSTRRRSFKNRTTSLTYDNEEDKKVAVPTRAASETVDPSKHALLAQRLRNLKNAAAQNKIEENSNREPRLRVEQVENNIADRPNIDPVLDYYKQHSTAAVPPGAPNGRNSRSIPSPLTYPQNIFNENHEDVAVSPKDDAYKEKNINTSFEYPPSSSDNNGFPRSSGGSTDYTPPGTQYGVAHAFTNPAYEGSLDSQDNAPLRQRRAGVSSTPRSELQPPRADPVERSESAARRFTTLIRVGSRDASIEQETETDQESMATKL